VKGLEVLEIMLRQVDALKVTEDLHSSILDFNYSMVLFSSEA
jgi:hypothetical protein